MKTPTEKFWRTNYTNALHLHESLNVLSACCLSKTSSHNENNWISGRRGKLNELSGFERNGRSLNIACREFLAWRRDCCWCDPSISQPGQTFSGRNGKLKKRRTEIRKLSLVTNDLLPYRTFSRLYEHSLCESSTFHVVKNFSHKSRNEVAILNACVVCAPSSPSLMRAQKGKECRDDSPWTPSVCECAPSDFWSHTFHNWRTNTSHIETSWSWGVSCGYEELIDYFLSQFFRSLGKSFYQPSFHSEACEYFLHAERCQSECRQSIRTDHNRSLWFLCAHVWCGEESFVSPWTSCRIVGTCCYKRRSNHFPLEKLPKVTHSGKSSAARCFLLLPCFVILGFDKLL